MEAKRTLNPGIIEYKYFFSRSKNLFTDEDFGYDKPTVVVRASLVIHMYQTVGTFKREKIIPLQYLSKDIPLEECPENLKDLQNGTVCLFLEKEEFEQLVDIVEADPDTEDLYFYRLDAPFT